MTDHLYAGITGVAQQKPLEITHIPTLPERVAQQLSAARANVQRLEELQALLEQHPEVNRILELMNQNF